MVVYGISRTSCDLRVAFSSLADQYVFRVTGCRMFEAAAMGSLLAGGPLVAVLGMAVQLIRIGADVLCGALLYSSSVYPHYGESFSSEPCVAFQLGVPVVIAVFSCRC